MTDFPKFGSCQTFMLFLCFFCLMINCGVIVSLPPLLLDPLFPPECRWLVQLFILLYNHCECGLCSCTALYVRLFGCSWVYVCVCAWVYVFPNSTIMSSYPSLLLPPPVLLLLFFSFPLLMLFPETSLCKAVARRAPKLGDSVTPNEANCNGSCKWSWVVKFIMQF